MKNLFFGCRRSEFSVFPENWKSVNTSCKKDWYVSFMFYMPGMPRKQILLKGMNQYKTASERKLVVEELLEYLKEEYDNNGWNPVLKTYKLPDEEKKEVSPDTKFNDALTFALKHLEGAPKSIEQAGYKIYNIKNGAIKLKKDKKRIGEIELSDIMAIMKFLKEDLNWSNDNYNKHRSYLMMCFEVLKEWGAVKFNLVKETKKLKIVKKKIELLTDEQIQLIKETLLNGEEKKKNFWRLIQIFHPSGARESEMIELKGKNVDLKKQSFKIVLKKSGGDYEEIEKIITNAALPFWEDIMKDCKPEDYVFSRGYKPGAKKLHPNRINKDWREWIKAQLGIVVDFYKFKHLYTTRLKNEQDSAAMNDHKGYGMVKSIYDVNYKEREKERLKKLGEAL